MSNKLLAWCKASSCHHGAYEKMERVASLSNIYGHVLSSSCVSNFLLTFVREQTHQISVIGKPAGGRWKLAGDSQHARVNQLEVEPNRQQAVGGSKKPTGASQREADASRRQPAGERENRQAR